jgi:cold shock CspA family protein
MKEPVVSDAEGSISVYKSEEGYGFVQTSDVPDDIAASVDVFFHITDVPEHKRGSIEEGERLEFDIIKTDEGFKAENIPIVSDAKGSISVYKPREGYGFIHTLGVPDDIAASVDVFFHITDVPEDSVEEGWRVKFDIIKTDEGFKARNIQIISKETVQLSERDKRDRSNKKEDIDDSMERSWLAEKLSKDMEDDKEEDNKERSPFSDDIRGDKNDLI